MQDKTRAGTYKTNLTGELAYKSYCPKPLPPSPPVELSEKIVNLLARASYCIAALDSMSANIPNIELFISMYVRKEALMSSQLEGTQSTLEDIFDPGMDKNSNRDVEEVVNYVKAAELAIERLKTFPLCCRLIRETHKILLSGTRGEEKTPGEFRRSQNWVGPAGCTLKKAKYIPPAPEDMTDAMSDLEKYMNGEDTLNVLIQAALIHYQFVTVHPFLDGNGRIGRLLVTLFLIEKKVLRSPAIYLSYYLKKNRLEYYDRLTEVREKGDFEQWIEFFLEAVIESASDGAKAVGKLTGLRDKNVRLIAEMGRSAKSCLKLFEYIESSPIIEIRKTAGAIGLSYNATAGAVRRLTDAGILVQTTTGSRNRVFEYKAYLDVLRDGTELI